MNEEKNKIADQAIELIKPLLGITEAVSSDGILYFKGNERVATEDRKNILLENIAIIEDNITSIKKLLV